MAVRSAAAWSSGIEMNCAAPPERKEEELVVRSAGALGDGWVVVFEAFNGLSRVLGNESGCCERRLGVLWFVVWGAYGMECGFSCGVSGWDSGCEVDGIGAMPRI